MPLIVPFAAPPPALADAVLPALALPGLQALLARRRAVRDDGAADDLNAPHERALARAVGLAGADGELPLAAWSMGRDGLDPGDRVWGLLTPVHWQVGLDEVVVTDPAMLDLGEGESRALFDAVRPLFEDDGFVLLWGAPLRWYAAHERLRHWRAPSLDRSIGQRIDPRAVDAGHPAARDLRRLQNEVQMLLHAHPLNEARDSAGRLPVNSVWLSGCGPRQRPTGDAELDERLRGPFLAGDWAAWQQAWGALDAERLRAWPADRSLVLCGACDGVTLQPAAASPWQRLKAGLGLGAAPTPAQLLASLR
ncbi:hypothetical protein [Aquabacterium sp. J223]|uniref:hypothetical protein n=1 Tax=Aquabacterium sp. J223 TaxID=2898431 RepID=UPI0021ADCC93|nr:hypothetical protein [Aquabacterium sp. J223]UUX95503.1 hypothetical protein LRS07_20230 [Aquabacterium sp. J223]